MYKECTYIVTGCTGYVGNVLTKKLLDDGCKVIGFYKDEDKFYRVFKGYTLDKVIGDITKKEDVQRLFNNANGNYVVIHTAAMVAIGERSETDMNLVNVTGTQYVVDECIKRNVKKLLHISSTEALSEKLILKEDLSNYTPIPKNVRKGYSRSKSLADEIVLNAAKKNNLDASLILLAGVLGPGDYSVTHMTQMMIDYVEGNLPASIKGGYNDFDIRDVADVLKNVVEKSKSGESYLFANKPDQINEVLDIIGKKFNKKKLVTLPLWLAYVGLPFLWLKSKVLGERPLYTSSALASLKAKANFPIGKVVSEFGYCPRPLENTVWDHMDFLVDEGFIKQ